jgi:hypothetical protein
MSGAPCPLCKIISAWRRWRRRDRRAGAASRKAREIFSRSDRRLEASEVRTLEDYLRWIRQEEDDGWFPMKEGR